MKKMINRPERVVDDMISGMVKAHPELHVLPETHVLVRADAPVDGKVGLVSGGGSGHEPAHGGYVGPGMLDAACAGDVFTSPSVDQMMKAIRAVYGGRGVLIIAKNYTGDNLNFDMASELLEMEGIKTAKVVVKDDVAVEESANTTGRRGVAGTVFVHKIAGAKAEQGASLEEVRLCAQKTVDSLRSFGVAISPCIIPAVGKPSFSLAEDEMEFGTGIHGETGVLRAKLAPAQEIAEYMVERILRDMPLEAGSEVAVLVNGSGATPLMELYILYDEVEKLLRAQDVTIYRAFVGEYMTSLEMAGASLSVLRLDDELRELLDAPANTPAFKQL